MAQRFYLSTASAPYTPATIRGAWDDTAGAVTKALAQYKGDGGSITTIARAETNVSTTYDVLLYRGVSYPLAGIALSGTVNVVLGVLESIASADMYWHIHIYVTTGDSDTPRVTLLSDYVENTTNEFGIIAATAGLALQSSQSISGTVTTGDRLVVEIGFISREASATSRTGTLYYGTKNATTLDYLTDLSISGDPTLAAGYIEFSESLIEDASANKIRDTQVLAQVLAANTPAIRDTQVLAQVLAANTPAIRDTQVFAQVLAANTPAIRDTQVLTQVLHDSFTTKFYLTTATAPYTPATIRGAWDDTAGAVTKALAQYPGDGGTITTISRAETNASATYDVLLYRGVSYPLQARTVTGNMNLVLGVLESDALADMYFHVHAYITTGDSDTVRLTLVNDYVENTTNEFGITALGMSLQTGQYYNSTIVAGDRLVIEIGFISREASATSRTGTLYYGTKESGTTSYLGDLTVGGSPTLYAGYVEFDGLLLEDASANDLRDTQVLTKVLAANTPAIRDTQVLTKVLAANTPAVRDTQVLIKVLHETYQPPTTAGTTFLSAQEKTARTLWNSATTSDDINIGQWGIIVLVTDNEDNFNGNTTLHVSVTIGSVNLIKASEYSASQGAANAGSTVSIWYFEALAFVASGAIVAVTLNVGKTAKAMTGHAFDLTDPFIITGVDGVAYEAITASDPGSLSATGTLNTWHCWVRAIGMEWPTDTLGTLTRTSTDWFGMAENGSTGNPSAGNQSVRVEYSIKLGTDSGASNPSLSAASDGASILAGLAIGFSISAVGSTSGTSNAAAVGAFSGTVPQSDGTLIHTARVGLFSVDAVGNVFNKNDQNVTMSQISRSSTEQRIIIDSSNPNTIGNPTVKNYLKLEAEDNFVIEYFSENLIITNLRDASGGFPS